jgi:hypothetical protein
MKFKMMGRYSASGKNIEIYLPNGPFGRQNISFFFLTNKTKFAKKKTPIKVSNIS